MEDKELLLKDLSARLPYGVKCKVGDNDTRTLVGVSYETNGEVWFKFGLLELLYETHKPIPYLRPMSSMTSAEKSELELMGFRYFDGYIINEDVKEYDDYGNHPYSWVDEIRCSEVMEFLNSHHFDYIGLIEKGLALEAKEGMYA